MIRGMIDHVTRLLVMAVAAAAAATVGLVGMGMLVTVRSSLLGAVQTRRRESVSPTAADVVTHAPARTVWQRPASDGVAGRLVRLDELGMRHMSGARRGWLTRLVVPYTTAGTIGVPWLAAGAAVGHVLAVALALVVTAVATCLLKHHWRRPRPDVIPALVRHQRTTSFPSGHAATAAAAACTLMAVAPQLAPLWVGMAVLMAASRVYVGVHWPTDVAAGIGLGVLLVALPLLAEAAI
jgi:membrane-associated phospholipid phosphatase